MMRVALLSLLLLSLARGASAQRLSVVPSPAGNQGQPALRISADGPGLIRVRGERVQGIDWPASGRGSVTVPLSVFADDTPLSLTVNGRAVTLDAPVPNPKAFDADAYALAALWRPGRAEAVRRWTLGAVGVIVLVIGIATHADPKRATRWTLLAAVVLCGGVLALFPAGQQRRTLAVQGRPGWQWVWVATAPGNVVREPFVDGLWFVAASPGQLREADPTLICDASGRPLFIQCRATAAGGGGRAVFISASLARP